ncbi:YicC family protein [Virgibacillus indicus]|uniref:YicC family protein n=1 Tax=Virgibacillus indicus TaxID=2024554 RepID=A0A265NEY4_9BACI|nr:YicC/YloC family endoribonuclease [Virgibacillus indicus]OZU90377.1 YicC family protein [Virgibacillus indicus]
MAISMTGFGRSQENLGNTVITVEIRSVNHRYLDFSVKIPRTFLFLEDKIKRIINSYFERGRVEVYIGIEGEGFVQKKLITDWELMDQFIQQISEVKDRYSLAGDIPVTLLTSFPEMITVQEIEDQPDNLKDLVLKNTEQACEQVLEMRKEEGGFLQCDLEKRMQKIKNTVSLLSERREYAVEAYRERIKKRVEAQIADLDLVDDARLHQEIVLLAEKGDITEEITRLLSHLEHFSETINNGGVIGRKLDFIAQEMHRETNTIGSKSTDPEISESTVLLKGEIEKIKEQVQNIE